MALFSISDFITWTGKKFTQIDWNANWNTLVNGFNSVISGKDIAVPSVETNELKGAAKSTDVTLSANSDIFVPSQRAVKTYIDNNVSNIAGIDRQLLINGNFDCWHYGTSFTNPSSGTIIDLGDWKIAKANGGGVAPSINFAQENSILPSNGLSTHALRATVTASGTGGAGRYYYLEQRIESPNFEKFRNGSISFGVKILAPAGAFIGLMIDDGVVPFTSSFLGTGVYEQLTINNYVVSNVATQLVIRIVFANVSNSPTVGNYYIAQAQVNRGTIINTFTPSSLEYEQALGLARKRMDNIGVNLVASINSMIVPTSSAHTVLNTSFVKQSYHRILRLYVAYSYTGGSIVTDGWIDVTLSDGSTTTNWFVDPGLKFNFNLHGQYVYNDVVDISYFQNLANLNVNVTFQVSGGSGRNLNGFLRLYTNLAP